MSASFLELPLDRDLYKPKKVISQQKPPLRVLITDAGGKIAYNLIYQICSGNVFGKDQEIIIHMISSRGSIHHKAIVLELEQCGFSTYKDFVVSSNPEIAYGKVDFVIAIATYEEIPGRSISNSLVYQMIKARQMAMYIQDFANKDAKIIFTGPSTKAITILLGAFRKFTPKLKIENISCVTNLDTVISKALLAAKLKTTTDKIKNVIIWASTIPDVHNATVRMYPPDDKGNWQLKDIPIADVIQDDTWLFTTFPMAIFKRLMTPDLINHGKAVTQSLVQHLQYLFYGSDNYDEILSMGVIAPSPGLYGVPPDCGFSFPVQTRNGTWKILPDINYDTATHLNMLRSIFNLTHSVMLNSMMKVVAYMLDYEATKKQVVTLHNRHFIEEVIEARNWTTRYFVTPSPAEGIAKGTKEKGRDSKKSIAWDDDSNPSRARIAGEKSSIRFSADFTRPEKKQSIIKRGSTASEHTDEFASILAA